MITNTYATGAVSGSTFVGGLVGQNDVGGTITAGYWDTETTGQSAGVGRGDSTGTTGLTTSQAFTQSSYAGFDFANTWIMPDGNTRPFLRSEYGTTIRNAHQLQLMFMDLTAHYTLANNIDASDTVGTGTHASGMWTTTGFVPVGGFAVFSGSLDGQGHTIGHLTIDREGGYIGLFGIVSAGGAVRDVGLTDVSIHGGDTIGSLAGSNSGTITNVYATGAVSGTRYDIGGLVGSNGGTITNAFTSVTVQGNSQTGGLAGSNGGTITNAYASGTVQANGYVGGLVGLNRGTITNAYATGAVTAGGESNGVGGLVGDNEGTITNTYAVSVVTGTSGEVGALVGINGKRGTINASFYDGDISGVLQGVGADDGFASVRGLNTDIFQNTESFISLTGDNKKATPRPGSARTWDFATTWAPSSEGYYPQLYALTPVVYVTPDDATKTYGDENPELTYGVRGGGPDRYVFGPMHDSLNVAGSIEFNDLVIDATTGIGRLGFVFTPSSASATSNQGVVYRIIGGRADFSITPRPITVTADAAGKTYGDAQPGFTAHITGGNLVNGDTLTGAPSVSDGSFNVGQYEIIQGGLGTTAGPNYNITFIGATYTVSARPITVTADSLTATKGKDLPPFTYAVTTGNLVGEDSLSGSLATEATSASAAGDYAITQGDLSASANYELTFVDGVLTLENPASTASSQVATFEQQRQPGDGHGRGGISLGGFDSDVSNKLAFQNLGMTLPSGLDDDKNK
jgi:hypothetical protein